MKVEINFQKRSYHSLLQRAQTRNQKKKKKKKVLYTNNTQRKRKCLKN